MWHRITFSISFSGSKFNETWKTINSQNICSLFTSKIYQTKVTCKGRGSHFYKNQKCRRFQLFHLRYFQFFLYALCQKMLNVSSEHSFKGNVLVLWFSGLNIKGFQTSMITYKTFSFLIPDVTFVNLLKASTEQFPRKTQYSKKIVRNLLVLAFLINS